ncbi:glutathione S-transferase [Halieaceae bacterium IMCC14734]|uniref:Glutathione S-transferase n=1 Tax=Candidatus Litorirhabdus singularis TaxID=2518993 RepID=A0ABT3TKU7_9GAMM|nr:glutathione S-transferase [Candidatus Litorirhabdus singularis]MCX2982957.1 glutathione S-transferase [Candidatus Litorirhabdus singularis]
MSDTGIQPLTVYGSNISYFTGKMENYLRVKGIAYTLEPMTMPEGFKQMQEKVGVSQMPGVLLGDGRWMTDTTAMIEWLEPHYPDNPILPSNPVQALVCQLLEDYADEWLWRPAMHYRWFYPEGAHLQSRHLTDELMAAVPSPGFFKRWLVRRRQRSGYTMGDGVTPQNVAGVEQIYLDTLQRLQAIFEQRPFLLGSRPSLADIGFSGPFFRHFGLDPIPLEIMRQRAPAVLEWMARLWNTRLSSSGEWLDGVPGDLEPLLQDIGRSYLPYLCANAEAVAADQRRFDVEVAGVSYRQARYSRYRVWCLQELRNRFEKLSGTDQEQARALLERTGCWEPLWRIKDLPLLPGQEQELPFRGSSKMVAAND